MLQRIVSRRLLSTRAFSTHSRIAVVGGGTCGLATSSQLAAAGPFKGEEITVFEPLDDHYYQPSFTMVGKPPYINYSCQDNLLHPGQEWCPEAEAYKKRPG